MHSIKKLVLWIGCIISCFSIPSLSVAQQDEGAVKAAFIYNFVNFIEWPGIVKGSIRTTVCVVGDSHDVIGYLSEISKKAPIDVITKSRDSRLTDCQILYIGEMDRVDIEYLIEKSRASPILTVSSAKEFAKRKGIIGFTNEAGQVKLEVNITAAKEAKLVVDSELLELVKIYQ
jgi:hypothetical protein